MEKGANILVVKIRSLVLIAAGGLVPTPATHAQPVLKKSGVTVGARSEKRLEDIIIVTARRRQESLQVAPVSVVALSGKDLEARSVTNLRSLQNFVPNLTFAPSQNVGEAGANVFIRGIGQEDFGVGAEAGVTVYVDGVYLPRAFGLLMNLTDVARIEVLRGPQGTLYGKDAIGGAINLISTMPSPDRERTASVIIGQASRAEMRAVINEPISRRLFARLAATVVNRGGYLQRLSPPVSPALIERVSGERLDLGTEGGGRGQGARLQLRWLTSDRLTADFSIDGSRKRDRQGAIHVDLIDPRFGIFPVINSLIGQGKLPGPQITGAMAPDDLLKSYAGDRNFTRQDFWGVSTVLTRELGDQSLKFIAAYRGMRSDIGTDDDGLYFDIVGSDLRAIQSQFSAELQLSRTAGALTYSAGIYAFDEKSKLPPFKPALDILFTCGCFYPPDSQPVFTIDPRRLQSASYAAYGQGNYKLTRELSVTLGARLTHERKTLDGASYFLDGNLQPTNTLIATGHANDSWNSFTYRAGLEYQANSRFMAYGSIARGFKSGGFNVRGDTDLPNMGFTPFAPETALTYEVGVRSEWLDGRLRINGTIFHTAYDDMQLREQTIVAGQPTTLIKNAARARIRGAEVELTALVASDFTLQAAYGHLSPRYLDVGRVPRLTLGSRFQRTPSDTLSVSINKKIRLRTGTIEVHGDFSYRSKEQFQITAAPNDQDGYGLFGGRIEYLEPDELWSVALFGTNLLDRRYRTAGRGTLINQVGFAYSSVGPPREIGLQVRSRF